MSTTCRMMMRPRRHTFCFIISLFQIVGGILIACGGLLLFFIFGAGCHEATLRAFIYGILQFFAGIFGVIAYKPSRSSFDVAAAETGYSEISSSAAVYVVLALISSSPFNIDTLATHFSMFRQCGEIVSHLALLLLLFMGHIIAAVGAGLALPDFCIGVKKKFQAADPTSPLLSEGTPRNTKSKLPTASSSIIATAGTPKPSSKSAHGHPFQLPEVRYHVQEIPGGGEKLTVVTLPEAEGVVYAVPEESYVIFRSGGSYVAPQSNRKLTPFFPSYTKVQVD